MTVADGPRYIASCRHYLAQLDSFFKADGPEFLAWHAVRLDWMATVEQSLKLDACESGLQLFAPTPRANRNKCDGFAHGARPPLHTPLSLIPERVSEVTVARRRRNVRLNPYRLRVIIRGTDAREIPPSGPGLATQRRE